MEKQVECYRTKTAKRNGRSKIWKGISVRPNFLLVAVFFLITLLTIKIIISGLCLRLDTSKLNTMNIAMAQESGAKNTTSKAPETKQTENQQPTNTNLYAAMANLKKKEQELKEREAALQKREQELAPLQSEVDAKIEQLNELQVRLTAMAKEIAEKEQGLKDEKINHLVSLYSAMDASKAAKIMDKLSLDTVVKILANMKGKSAGQILGAMNADKGAVISESLSKMQ